jgi:hypothetical protein
MGFNTNLFSQAVLDPSATRSASRMTFRTDPDGVTSSLAAVIRPLAPDATFRRDL